MGLSSCFPGAPPINGDESVERGEWVREATLWVTGDLSVGKSVLGDISLIWHGVVTEGVD